MQIALIVLEDIPMFIYLFIFFRDLSNLILGMVYWTRHDSHLPAGRAKSTQSTSRHTCQNLISMTRVRIVCISISLCQRYTPSCWFVLIVKLKQMSCRFLSCKVTNRWTRTTSDFKAKWYTRALMIFNGAFDRNHFILVDLRKWMDDFVVRKYNNTFKTPNKLILLTSWSCNNEKLLKVWRLNMTSQ